MAHRDLVTVTDHAKLELINVRDLRKKLETARNELIKLRPAPRTEVDLESLITLVEQCLNLVQ